MRTKHTHPPNHTERTVQAAGTRFDDSTRTPQEYKILTDSGAEATELAKRAISRRQLLTRVTGLTLEIAGADAVSGTRPACNSKIIN